MGRDRPLSEEKLGLTFLINPTRLECFSINELIVLVKHGQKRFHEFTLEKLPGAEMISNPHARPILPCQLPVSQESLNIFLHDILPTSSSQANLQCDEFLKCAIAMLLARVKNHYPTAPSVQSLIAFPSGSTIYPSMPLHEKLDL